MRVELSIDYAACWTNNEHMGNFTTSTQYVDYSLEHSGFLDCILRVHYKQRTLSQDRNDWHCGLFRRRDNDGNFWNEQ